MTFKYVDLYWPLENLLTFINDSIIYWPLLKYIWNDQLHLALLMTRTIGFSIILGCFIYVGWRFNISLTPFNNLDDVIDAANLWPRPLALGAPSGQYARFASCL